MVTEDPIIVILGSTATGKSKLAIELAKMLNGEIISADSMQVYHGLDIITNKVTAEECEQVSHHMMNLVSPPQEYTVVQYKHQALSIINDLHRNNKLPIVVGGTNYYIESLLWEFLVDGGKDEDGGETSKCLTERKHWMEQGEASASSKSKSGKADLYEQLKEVDPERASEIHPKNIRKIARSLQIYQVTGKKHSDLLNEQKVEGGSSHLSGPLRFSRVLMFWLTCEQEVLNQRISDRMKKMVEQGLKDEITLFYKQSKTFVQETAMVNPKSVSINATKRRPIANDSLNEVGDADVEGQNTKFIKNTVIGEGDCDDKGDVSTGKNYVEGLFQAIGFKEFHSFITSKENDPQKLELLFCEGLDNLKRKTIKYSKKQVKWVRNRFLGRPDSNMPPIYELDTTDAGKWGENVLKKSLDIAHSFIQGETTPFHCMDKISSLGSTNQKYICEVCNGRIVMGDLQWKEHLVSKKHRWHKMGKKRKFEDGVSIIDKKIKVDKNS